MLNIAIIGAGAAGCFAAAQLSGKPALRVVIYEKTHRHLQKVKVSGGGRCNITHACFDVPELLQFYPRGKALLRKTLYRFGPKDTIRWFSGRGVQVKQEEDGRMFPVSDDSETVIRCLERSLEQGGIPILYHKALTHAERTDSGFHLHFADGTQATADRVLVTCGGFAKPEQYHWLEALGHSIAAPVPSLFTFNLPRHPITQLMGLSVTDAVVKIAGTKFSSSGPLLITHWGLSGPAVLRTSAWAARELGERNYRFTAVVNWLGGRSAEEIKAELLDLRRQKGMQSVVSSNPFSLPRRLWEYLLQRAGMDQPLRWADLPAAVQNRLIESLTADRYDVEGKTTFKEEFVTCGGIQLAEVNPDTMESRLVPGLYFAGEILDVDGITGGFNFQHAWSSAWVAAEALGNIKT